MVDYKIPPSSGLIDQQFVTVRGPDGIQTGFQYDAETQTMWNQQNSVVIPSFHGGTHVSEDPVPLVTIDNKGLMDRDDKAKLDEIVQTRLGVLGFQGAGFPDDGGWLQGDIILSAGTEFISLERIGNVVRFTVDSPIPLNCGCFEAGCPILMADGTTKLIEEVKEGDRVITHTGNIKTVKKALSAAYDGDMLDIKTAGHNGKFAVTPGHPIYSYAEAINSRRTRAIRDATGLILDDKGENWVFSHDLSEKDFVVKRYSHTVERDVSSLKWADFYDNSITIDGKTYPARKSSKGKLWKDGMAKGIPSFCCVDDDLLDLFGYYLAEGCYSDKNGVRFTVHRNELTAGEIGGEILRIVRDKFGIEPAIQNKPSCKSAVDIQFFSVVLGRVFKKWFGDKAQNKRLPEWIMDLPAPKQYRALLGLLKGDGSKRFSNKGVVRLEISSPKLTEQMRFLAERSGLEFRSFAKRRINSPAEYDNIEFSATHNKQLFEDLTGITPDDPHIHNYLKTTNETLHKISSISKRHYKGKVYNFEIEDDHSYIVNGVVVHNCEECAQIFWIQDESDTTAVRPPSCAGKLPGVNSYGELKVYLMPENTIIDPANPLPTLNTKSSYPAFIFKRYENSTVPGFGEMHAVLARNTNLTTQIGWSMTPGASGKVENIWFMGLDDEGNQIRFEMDPDKDADMLGQLLYKGHSLTRRMGVVTGYSSNILSDNLYTTKFWNIDNEQVIGDDFTATNVWQYNNPGNSPSALDNPQSRVLDATIDLLPIGTLVQLWEVQVGESGSTRIVRRYFNKEPRVNPFALWSWSGAIKFGDLLIEREELRPGAPSEDFAHEVDVSDVRLFERTIWGITVFEDRLILTDDGEATGGTETEQTLRADSVSEIFASDAALPQPNTVISALLAGTCVSGFVFIVNQWVGNTLKFTSGPLAGQEFPILQNAATTVTIFGDATAAEPGNTFEIFSEGKTGEPSGVPINNQFVADIDPALPGLKIRQTDPDSDSERPVYIWHRINHKNFYMKALIGQPDASMFPPIDILLRAPVDSFDDVYLKIIRRGVYETGPFRGMNYIVVKGAHWGDLPPSGVLRTLTGVFRNETWHYFYKAAFDRWDDDSVALIGMDEPFLFDEDFVPDVAADTCGTAGTGTEVSGTEEGGEFVTVPNNTTVAQLLHAEYNAAACRLEFSINDTSEAESVQLQFKVGILDMGEPYELDRSVDPSDDYVRGMRPGDFAVSKIYTQDGFIVTGTESPESDPENFRVNFGGFLPSPINGELERWNELEVMYRDEQIWLWWNRLLIPPDATESSNLPTPVAINTPYFPVESTVEVGKIAMRLWPGAVLRKIEVRDQPIGFNEFTYGQLEISS